MHAEIKIKLDEEDIEIIVQRVVQALRPLLVSKASEADEIFTPESLAQYLKVDISWVYKKVSLRQIPFFKSGKYVRFKKSAIDKWIEENSFKTGFAERLGFVRTKKKRLLEKREIREMLMSSLSFSGYGEKGEIYRKIFGIELITSVENAFFTILENFIRYAPEDFELIVREIKKKVSEESQTKMESRE